jgi:membrane protein DedA with SNARE-associated domain
VLIAVAAAAAIIGDNVGFAIGRHGGRRLFERPGPFHAHRLAALEAGEPFFERHGPKAVFLGRWVAGIALGVYFIGHAFEEILGIGGIVAAALVSGAVFGVFVWRRLRA